MSNIFHPWEGVTEPFRIFGNLYFVGTIPASTHLIDTGEGLIVMDPGYPQSLYVVVHNIYSLGFDVKNIKYIIATHGHYDHIGAVRALAELTGAKTFIGKEDLTYANGIDDLTWAKEIGTVYHETFEPDVLLGDDDEIKLGNTVIKVKAAPGHTPGTKAFFFDVTDGVTTLRAAMHGGVGMNSMQDEFLKRYSLTTETREKFVPSIDAIIDEKVDIVLGNHVWNNDTINKGKNITDKKNPFVNSEEWKQFLGRIKQEYRDIFGE